MKDVGAKERLASLQLVHPEVVRSRLRGLNLEQASSRRSISSILGTRAHWLPHQIDVAVSSVGQDPVRLLLSDEVGLGKTVEAAMIYAGLRAEGRANKVLILTPDSLAIQWLGEIYRKTHELMVLFDDERYEDIRVVHGDENPFEAHQRFIVSLDRVAGDEMLAKDAASVEWDLVIIDEAHHLRWAPIGDANLRYGLSESLAKQARHLLLLTATPMALDPAEYQALLRLLNPERFDDPTQFEKTHLRISRLSELARKVVAWKSDECVLTEDDLRNIRDELGDFESDLSLVESLAVTVATDGDREEIANQILLALQDRHGLSEYVVRNRRGPVGGLPVRKPITIPLTPSPLQEILLEVGESVVFELVSEIESPRDRCDQMGRMLRAMWATPGALLEVARAISPVLVQQLEPHVKDVVTAPPDDEGLPTGDSRLRWLVEFIREQPNEKLLVFVESSIAVRSLKEHLSLFVGDKIAVFYRDLSARDQDRQVAWFRDPQGPQIMLSTEAGGEGRNFQFCHRLVLYDLPWRPATIEQRIGRIDRVGQEHDVQVFVPFFRSGYEAAILKVMERSIGVLERTVGGIDHALEYVSLRLGGLIYDNAGPEEWQELYDETEELVGEARLRIERSADPILDLASYDPKRAASVLARVPEELETEIEKFILGYASYCKLNLTPQGHDLVGVDGGPRAATTDSEGDYYGTFRRSYALDHEEVDFLSFGHPLVEQALDWSKESVEQSAGLALRRGASRDGAFFLWVFGVDFPEGSERVSPYFNAGYFTYALDEEGNRHRELETMLMEDERELEKMDPRPLRSNQERWRRLVEQNFDKASKLSETALEKLRADAGFSIDETFEKRKRCLLRTQARELASGDIPNVEAAHEAQLAAMRADWDGNKLAVTNVRMKLYLSLAVRMVKNSHVSG
ncbi:MAG: SNF2-related protein [Myxococcota bacterium]|nr:SNF2-related protein [Myxococcota bacterium]